MTFKAMIAALALLPGLSGSTLASHAETLGTVPSCTPPAYRLADEPLQISVPQQLLSTQLTQASGTVGFGSRRADFICPTAACAHSSAAPAAAAAPVAVPQPKMLMLCGLGLLLFGLYRRRK